MFSLAIKEGVATLTLNRAPVNAISEEWLDLFNARLDALAAERNCNVLHIRSDQKVFCAGADLKEVRQRMDAPDGADRMFAFVAGIQRLYSRVQRLQQITLAEIGGAAMGGGLELALACDLRIAANEAKLGLPEARLGLIPGAGGTQRLTRICGPALAKRLIFGAEIVDGTTAVELGVVQWSVPRTDLARAAGAIARDMASLPGAALAASKTCIAAAENADREGYVRELEFTRRLFESSDTRRRVDEFLAGAAAPPVQMKTGAAR
ncbi:MAG TPA: enoyl-CoA hydratase/isomerase family protein [Pseudolabrys sp.]|nr:enoyl-CoA hydratase/isomerase family protein [Pseudolabrys sp.]